MRFTMRSDDGSSKCNIAPSNTVSGTVGDTSNAIVHGAVFVMDAEQKPDLDIYEGLGVSYHDCDITVEFQGRELPCFTYVAADNRLIDDLPPYHWYKQMVVLGAQYLRLPADYIAELQAVESMHDADEFRQARSDETLKKIKAFS